MKNEVPEQHEGRKMDTTAQAIFPSIAAARQFYGIAKSRLLNVSNWAEICKVPLSVFTLTDDTGATIRREAKEGDYLKIDIPGPGTDAGNGFDWVRIEKITEESDGTNSLISLQARPAVNPSGDDSAIAHFFTDAATSTFQVKQIGNEVWAEEHGRNEVANLDTAHLLDNIRNAIVSAGAKIGISYPQWKSLVTGLLAKTY